MTSSNGNIFHITGHLHREFTIHQWIPCTKARLSKTMVRLVISDAIAHYDIIVMVYADTYIPIKARCYHNMEMFFIFALCEGYPKVIGHSLPHRARGAFQKHLWAPKSKNSYIFTCSWNLQFCNVWVRYSVWNFKGTLWNSIQNILPIHWKIWVLPNIEILRALRFRSSYMFLKRPPEMWSFDVFFYRSLD